MREGAVVAAGEPVVMVTGETSLENNERHVAVTPRTLRGFRDLLPEVAEYRNRLVSRIAESFRTFGFRPIVTPALEYAEVVMAKGGAAQDHEVYAFRDKGGRDVALRTDLTIPLARFVAEHSSQLLFPLRAFQVGPVWRGERPQRGRFREFVQCDADIVGTESVVADADIIAMMHAALGSLDIRPFSIRLSDRRVLSGLLTRLGIASPHARIMRLLDKMEKVSAEELRTELQEHGVAASATDVLMNLGEVSCEDDDATLGEIGKLVAGSATGEAGVRNLYQLRELLDVLQVPTSAIRVDPTIVRGLDYYTGAVFETTYLGAPSVGSICSGGRYDDLSLLYSRKRLPGVGGSIGVDRLLSAILDVEREELPRDDLLVVLATDSESGQPVLLRLAEQLRRLGFGVDVDPDPRPAKRHRRHADRRRAAIVGTVTGNEVRLLDLTTGRSWEGHVEAAASGVAVLASKDPQANRIRSPDWLRDGNGAR